MVTFYLLVLSLIILILILNNIILLLNFLFIILLLLLLLLINNIIPITLLFVLIYSSLFNGYEVYEELNYPISYPSIGDCLDRYIPRFNEMIESCRIIHGLFYIPLCSYFYSTFTGFSIIINL